MACSGQQQWFWLENKVQVSRVSFFCLRVVSVLRGRSCCLVYEGPPVTGVEAFLLVFRC